MIAATRSPLASVLFEGLFMALGGLIGIGLAEPRRASRPVRASLAGRGNAAGSS